MEGKLKERSDLHGLFSTAVKATYYTRSFGGVERCVDLLRHLKSLSLSVEDIVQYWDPIAKLETLRSHMNPKIRMEAEALVLSWMKTMYAQGRDNSSQKEKKIDPIKHLNLKTKRVTPHDSTMKKKKTGLEIAGNKNISSLTTKPVFKDSTNPKSVGALANKKREIVDLFEAAKKAADVASAKGILAGKPEASRCVEALSLLTKIKITPKPIEQRMIERLERLTKHKDRKICHAASALFQIWTQKKTTKETEAKGSTTKTIPNSRRQP